jgi:hypothetical protein
LAPLFYIYRRLAIVTMGHAGLVDREGKRGMSHPTPDGIGNNKIAQPLFLVTKKSKLI